MKHSFGTTTSRDGHGAGLERVQSDLDLDPNPIILLDLDLDPDPKGLKFLHHTVLMGLRSLMDLKRFYESLSIFLMHT